MNPKTFRVLLAVLWIASIGAAYFIGQTATPPGVQATAGGITSGESDESATMGRRKAGTVVEAFTTEDSVKAPGAPGRQNVQDLIARARVEMGSGMNGMMNMRGMLRAIAPLAELDDAQIQEALQEVENTVREPQQKMMFYSLLLGQWAEHDGPAALAYAEEKLKTKSPFDFGVRAAVLGAWSRKDPDAAWRWFQGNQDKNNNEPNTAMLLSTVFAGMASRDLDVAFTRMNTLDEEQRRMALNGIASSAGDERSRQRLIDRAATLSPELRKQVQETVIRPWAMTDPEAALKWLRSRPEEEQPGLRTAVGNTLMMADPKRGADLLLEGASEKDRPQIYETVVSQWAYRDPKEAAEWLSKQPQGTELDGARRNFAINVVRRDPVAAMDWAKAVVNPEQRTASVQQVYSAWRSRDAEAADAGLDSSGLDATQIDEIKQSAAKTTPPRQGGVAQ